MGKEKNEKKVKNTKNFFFCCENWSSLFHISDLKNLQDFMIKVHTRTLESWDFRTIIWDILDLNDNHFRNLGLYTLKVSRSFFYSGEIKLL